MRALSILCPFCFNKLNPGKLFYRCNCKEPGTANYHIIENRKADSKGFCTCDLCNHTTTKKVCYICRKELPADILENDTKIISIVGAANSGKSYYVGTLLRQIMEKHIFSTMGTKRISTKWVVGSGDEYAKRFKKPLESQSILPPTQKNTDIVKDNPPILIELMYETKKLFGTHTVQNTYSFFDAAGETFENEDDLAAITPYIAHSEGIVLILDPCQIPHVDAAVSAVKPNLSKASDKTYSDILNNTASVVRTSQRLTVNNKIKIPLCIAFSKWDLLIETPNLLPGDLMVSKPSQYNLSGYNASAIETISSEIRSLLMQWEPNLVNLAESSFEEVKYFGFSAWGSSKSATNGKAPPIASFRVEDPMLFILNKDGIV